MTRQYATLGPDGILTEDQRPAEAEHPDLAAHDTLGLATQAEFDDHSARHDAGGADALTIDAAAATGSLRTLGTGAAQAAQGTHGHKQVSFPDSVSAAADYLARIKLAADAEYRLRLGLDASDRGEIAFGGGSAAADVTLVRSAAGVANLVGSASLGALGLLLSGDTSSRLSFFAAAEPRIQFGPGNAASDVRLQRSAASVLTLDNNAGGAALLDLVGGQVKFPATQNASANANTLDDYEEGTWTPVLAYDTPGTGVWVHTIQIGRYRKFSDICIWAITVTAVPTNGTASGFLRVTGLPFTVAAIASFTPTVGVIMQGYTKATHTTVGLRPVAGLTNAVFEAGGSGQAVALLSVGDIPSGGTVSVRGSGFYQV